MNFVNGSRIHGTQLAVIAILMTAVLPVRQAKAETIFTINGVDVDSAIVDIYFESRLGGPDVRATPEQREALMAELRDIYLLSTQEHAKTLAEDPKIKAQIQLQTISLLAREVASEFYSNIEVTEEDLQARYAILTTEIAPIDFKARHILLQTQGEAIDVITQLNDGADFAALAVERSIGPTGPKGGDLDWFSPDTMVKPFSDAVAALEDGKYNAEPVQTQFGWHVILREDSRQSIPPTFETARPEILQSIENEKFQVYLSGLRAVDAQ
jgi:peptidyl-prolyl cis-trans isomerase C